MKTIANLLWFLVSGLWLGLSYIILGLVACLTLIGIPFGIQAIKLAFFVMWPFGRELAPRDDARLARGLLNVVWILVGGLWLALEHVLLGLILCLTIVGIPFGIKNFKMAQLALWPFSYSVVRSGSVDPNSGPVTD